MNIKNLYNKYASNSLRPYIVKIEIGTDIRKYFSANENIKTVESVRVPSTIINLGKLLSPLEFWKIKALLI